MNTNQHNDGAAEVAGTTMKRLCDWCKKPMREFWVTRIEIWKRYIKPDDLGKYMCKRCWNKLPAMEDRYKL
jgi:hypothetical protein